MIKCVRCSKECFNPILIQWHPAEAALAYHEFCYRQIKACIERNYGGDGGGAA